MRLVKPDISHIEMAKAFVNDFSESEYPNSYTRELDIYLKHKTYQEWLEYLECNQNKLYVKEYFVICKDKIIGMVEIRYRLHKSLINEFGHIGYVLSPRMRRKKMAVPMLKLALRLCAKAGLSQVIITCQRDNIASYKTIEKCGGKLLAVFNSKIYKEPYRRYAVFTLPK